nr:hypothetical protein [Acaryochloris marina]
MFSVVQAIYWKFGPYGTLPTGCLGLEQAITALVSCYTATEMATLLPKFLSLKTPEQLETVNQALQKEIQERQRAEVELRNLNDGLETLVQERTAELKKVLNENMPSLGSFSACERP